MNLLYTARLQEPGRRRPSGDPRGGVCNRGHSGSMPEIRFGQADVIANGKAFTMMSYPNRSHAISEGRGTTMHLYTLLTTYLNTRMPAGGR
jgi:hypothetical protein